MPLPVAERHDRVEKNIFRQIARRNARDQCLPAFLEIAVKLVQIRAQLLLHESKSRLRQHHHTLLAVNGGGDIVLQMPLHHPWGEFGGLLDITLHQGDRKRRPRRRDKRKKTAGACCRIERDRCRCHPPRTREPGAGEQRSNKHQQQRQHENTAKRRNTVQRRMQRGITHREPRKTGQHISAQQFRRDPGRRNQQHPPPAVRRTATP